MNANGWCPTCDAPARIFDGGFADMHLCDATPQELQQLQALVAGMLLEMHTGTTAP